MGKVRRVMRCYNCGAVLQSMKKSESGFIGKDLMVEGAENRVLYCHNCYEKMKAINTGMLELDADDDILKILDDAVATDALIIWVVDLISFNGTLNPEVVKKIKKLKIVVFGTKLDLMPKHTDEEALKQFVIDRFKEAGITPHSVRLFGNTENIVPGELLEALNKTRQGHDAYMIGSLASGKTSIINKMLKGYSNKSKRAIKTEYYPHTTVKVLEIPLSNSSFFYELPGFSLNTSVLGKVEKETRAIITPRKEVKAEKATLDEGEAFVVGSLAAFTLIEGKKTRITFYGAEGNEFKKMKNEKVDSFFRENVIKRSLRPVSERFFSFTDYDLFEYTMENDGQRHDISITGLGWISFEAKGQIIRVIFPKGAALKETVSKIKKD
ncbi:MAG: hypothetical protein K6C32_02720 [Bacilli bacterium]|nr:hypothetical protein [Bacilli bacterium]